MAHERSNDRATVRRLLLAVISTAVVVARVAPAQDLELRPFEEAHEASQLDLDLAVPESPAFTALGLSPENITRPATPREFAVAALTALDKQGNFQAGLAIDTVPYLLIAGDSLSLASYRGNPGGFNLRRQLSRAQLSIATTKGTSSADESVRLALGFRVTPYSKGDPRMDDKLIGCLQAVSETLPQPAGGAEELGEDTDLDAAPDEAASGGYEAYFESIEAWEALALKQSDACLASAENRLSQATALDIGAAPAWIQEGGTRSNLTWDGATFWTSFAWNLAENGDGAAVANSSRPQLIGHARFRLDESVASPLAPTGFAEQDSLLVGGRLRWGGSRITFSLEGAYTYEDPDFGGSASAFVGGLASDIKVYEQLWVNVALGGTAGGGDERIVLGATFKWGGASIDLMQLVGGPPQTGQ